LEIEIVAEFEKDLKVSEKDESKPEIAESESVELSEEDLESVAGGINVDPPPSN
jgi:hypothetical protein